MFFQSITLSSKIFKRLVRDFFKSAKLSKTVFGNTNCKIPFRSDTIITNENLNTLYSSCGTVLLFSILLWFGSPYKKGNSKVWLRDAHHINFHLKIAEFLANVFTTLSKWVILNTEELSEVITTL